MSRKVHSEELRERQNMRDAARTRKNGDWCVVGFCSDWDPEIGLQGYRYESETDAKEVADELDADEEFQHVREHKVMKHEEFEDLCEERGINREFPWN
jgi:hypothetical protein